MSSEQQEQALEFFRKFAADWRRRAAGEEPRKFNIIHYRNDYVLEVARRKGNVRRYLDVGCGSGELVCEMAALGISAEGVDFSPEMIDLGRALARERNLSGATFLCVSVFDHTPAERPLDLVSANGFIEYISREQLLQFLTMAHDWLVPGGSLVIGSRNRLFNLFSLNDYTQMEVFGGTQESLLDEALAIAAAGTWGEAIAALRGRGAALSTMERHPLTGVEVSTRHQYTPAELVALLDGAGFDAVELRPIHYHAAPPVFARSHPETHVATALLMQEHAPEAPALLPFSSTFMVHGVKG